MATYAGTNAADAAGQEETVAEVLAHMTEELGNEEAHAHDGVTDFVNANSSAGDNDGLSLLCSEEDVDSSMSPIHEESEMFNCDGDESAAREGHDESEEADACDVQQPNPTSASVEGIDPESPVDVAAPCEVSNLIEASNKARESTCEVTGVKANASICEPLVVQEDSVDAIDSDVRPHGETKEDKNESVEPPVAADGIAHPNDAITTPSKSHATRASTSSVHGTPARTPSHSTPAIPLNAPSCCDFTDRLVDENVQYQNNGDGFFEAASTKQMLPSSTKKLPLTHPTSPDLRSAKRHFRCVDHGCAQDTPQDTTRNLHLENLVSRENTSSTTVPRHIKRMPTEPHSPFLLTAQRAKLKPVEHGTSEAIHIFQAAELMRRDHSPQVYVAKTTVPHSPFLATAQRAKMHPNPAPSKYDGGYIDPATLVQRSSHHTDKENAQHVSLPRYTRPQSPNLHTNKRTRTPLEVEDVDGMELAKPFHANPMPSVKRRKVVAPSRTTTTIPVSPNLESVRRHKAYQEEFHVKVQADLEAASLKRVFKAAPLPLYNTAQGLNSNVKRMPLTEIEPFHMPGERFDELAKERLAKLKMEEEKARLQKMVFKATPIMTGSRTFLSKKVEAKPLTECASPDLAVKRRAIARAEFDSKDKARRDMEEAEARRKMDIAKEQDAIALKAYRATLSFKHHT
ncbi:hypothetical protein DYB32_005946 [Aphanomyces invadans]|uniref:TPX2 C-terminal domain-containing protein n=1 Tax=Aphanomyces invadans TaxID=157072 RepID=A0A3R6WK60_9STRA|nr:hypothetical protein DYB32_005946 [Aphanomyces invadans]